MIFIVKYSIIFVLVLISALFDAKTKKIPNKIFFIGILSAFLFDVFIAPIKLFDLFIKFLFIVGLFFYGMLNLMGIGDIKLWMILVGYIGIVRGSIVIGIAAILLIIKQVLTDKSNFKLVFLTFNQLLNKEKVVIVEQKSYAFAPYIVAPLALEIIYEGIMIYA